MILKLLVYAAILPLLTVSGSAEPSAKRKNAPKFSEQLRKVNCADHGAGSFVFGCSSEYFVCEVYGNSFLKRMFQCPKGHSGYLKMNPDVNMCEEEKNVALCQHKADGKYASKINDKEPFSCKDKENGYYAIDRCSQEYAQCDNGKVTTLLCSSPQLYFNPTTRICDHREKCGRQPKPVSLDNVKPISFNFVQPVPSGVTCPEKEGLLFNGGKCSRMMWRCENGSVATFNCPRGLFFSEKRQLCTIKSEVPECNLNNPVQLSLEHQVPEKYSLNCKEQANGFYEISECNRDYMQCSNGQSLILSCPGNLFFDFDTGTCDYFEKCDVNRKIPDTSTNYSCIGKINGFYTEGKCLPYYIQCSNEIAYKIQCQDGLFFSTDRCVWLAICQNPPPPTSPLPPVPQARVHLPIPQFNCRGGTGDHEIGTCRNEYVMCSNNIAYHRICPPGSVFSQRRRSCIWARECYRELRTNYQKQDSQNILHNGQLDNLEAPIMITLPTDSTVDFNCSNKTDGEYTVDHCGRNYVICRNGTAEVKACEQGTVHKSGQCVIDDSCPPEIDNTIRLISSKVSRQERPSLPAGTNPHHSGLILPSPKPLTNSQDANEEYIPPHVPDYKCPIDGWFSEGYCLRFYIQCSNSYAYRFRCAANLVWSGYTCIWPSDCHDLGAENLESKFHPQIKTKKPGEFLVGKCMNKPDGFMPASANGCSADYYECVANLTLYKRCTGDTVFNPTSMKCEAPESIAICEKYSRKVPYNCDGKRNGYYEAGGCKSFFYGCTNGVASKHDCPEDLFYDHHTQKCHAKQYVPICGGSRYEVTPEPRDPAPVDPFCYDKLDGCYSAGGCQSFYYNCVSKSTTKVVCPTGLFYDPETNSCRIWSEVPVCAHGQPPKPSVLTTFAPPVPLPEVDLFCTDKANGYHSVGDCSNSYYYCNGQVASKVFCPPSTFYDAEIQRCDLKQFVPTCGGTRPVTVSPPSDARAPVELDYYCQDKSDGTYTPEPCSTYFYSCLSRHTAKMSCPSGLFYDLDVGRCERREHNPYCNGTRPEIEPVKAIATVDRDNFCDGKKNGIYTTRQCPSFYYYCNSHQANKMYCTDGLYYDIDIDRCERKEHVPVCGGTRPVTEATTTTTTAAPIRNVCSNRADGNYESEACGTFFYVCKQHRFSMTIHCPVGLYYDAELQKCEMKEHIPRCGGRRPEIRQPQLPQTDTFCSDKVNGVYAAGQCENFYYECAGQLALKKYCPISTYYHSQIGLCLSSNSVPGCEAVHPTPAVPVKPNNVRQPCINRNTNTEMPCGAAQLPSWYGYCQQKDNGNYAIDGVKCVKNYYICQDHKTFPMICPPEMFFDPESLHCLARYAILSCAESVPQPHTPPPPQDIDSQNSKENIFCLQKAAGDYGIHGCQSFFIRCNTTGGLRVECPPGQFYDPELSVCKPKAEVTVCGGVRPQPNRKPSHRTIPDFSCAGKGDGDYSIGCSDLYFSCVNHLRYVRFCPKNLGLMFSQDNICCDIPANVRECGGTSPLPQNQTNTIVPSRPVVHPSRPVVPPSRPVVPETGVHYPVEKSPSVPRPVEQRPPRDEHRFGQITSPNPEIPKATEPHSTNPCYNKDNSLYANGSCNEEYFQCTNGDPAKFWCPTNHAFYEKEHKCVERTKIPYCPEYIKVVQNVQSPYGK